MRPADPSAAASLPRADKTPPVCDREVHRRQRPRGEDRAGDDDAGGRLLVDHQIGPDAEHGGLQGHAHDPRHRAKPAADVARALLGVEKLDVQFVPFGAVAVGVGLFRPTADRCDSGVANNAERRKLRADGVRDV
jgi:hypothetical protein